jgi:hypothetical protein
LICGVVDALDGINLFSCAIGAMRKNLTSCDSSRASQGPMRDTILTAQTGRHP